MLGQALVQKSVVGCQQVKHRAVVAKQVLEKPDRLLVHVAAQRGKLGEALLVFVVVLVEPTYVQPLAGELFGHAPGARIAEHAPRLAKQHVVVRQLAAGRRLAKRGVRHRGPQEITQPRGQLRGAHCHRLGPIAGLLAPVQKRGRSQHTREGQLDRLLVIDLALTQRPVKLAQPLLLVRRQCPTPGATGQVDHRFQLLRFVLQQARAKRRDLVQQDRLVRLPRDDEVGPVLCRELNNLLVGDLFFERLPGDVQQLIPESIQLGLFFFVEHEPLHRFVLAEIQRQRHDLVDRYDLRVTNRRRKQVAEIVEAGVDALVRVATRGGDDGVAWRQHKRRGPGQPRGQLHAAGTAVFRLEVARDDERPALGQCRRNAQLDHLRRFHDQVGRDHRVPERVTAKSLVRSDRFQQVVVPARSRDLVQMREQRGVRRARGRLGFAGGKRPDATGQCRAPDGVRLVAPLREQRPLRHAHRVVGSLGHIGDFATIKMPDRIIAVPVL